MAYSKERFTIMMSAEYRSALDDLQVIGHYRDRSALFDAAMALLARDHGVELPPRANPVGDWRERHGQKKSDVGT